MKKILLLLTLSLAGLLLGYIVRKSKLFSDRTSRLAARDFEFMKEQVGINIPNRPNPAQDPDAPNAANYDESKVKPYTLPDPLILKNGEKVKTPKDWWEKRRPEIVEDFEREMYGRVPSNIPSVTWTVVSVKEIMIGSYTATQKTLSGTVHNATHPAFKVEMELIVATPSDANGPVPVVLKLGSIRRRLESEQVGWEEHLLSERWGYAVLKPGSIQADSGAGLTQGIIGLMNEGKPRKPEDWGVLRAWAWGASRAVDYFETDKTVDAKRLAIEGLSRYGKAALVAMAFDPRLSLGFIGSTGVGGTKIMRRNFAEQVENVVTPDNYFWFCGNFMKYASSLTPDDLPVDAHELIALCAPRPVFISSGSPQGDQWADPKGMFLGGVHAGPVYRLLGKTDLGTNEFPLPGTPLIDGEIAFRQHEGGHTTGPNWATWIEWASKYWGE